MTRTAIFLALAGAITGCGGEVDAPRYVPAGPNQGTTARPATSADPARATTPPKNIATH